MPLSCSCGDPDYEPGMKICEYPWCYTELKTSRRKRCCSCNDLMDIGSIVAAVPVYRVPEHEIEIAIHGEDGEIPLATKHLCEECADIFFSLEELGYCVSPMEDQHDLLAEYHDNVADARSEG